MSKIQEFFSAGGRSLFDSEKPVVDAFNVKYGRALAGAVVPQNSAERVDPQAGQNTRTLAGRVLTSAARHSEQTRLMAGSALSHKQTSSVLHRLAVNVLANDKDSRASQSVSAKSRTMKRLNIVTVASKKLSSQKGK
jgi:hypothetical protein